MIPEACKSCAHRYNDMSEGQNCRRVPRQITLRSGDVLLWPGQPAERAFRECAGDLHSPRLLGRLAYWLGT